MIEAMDTNETVKTAEFTGCELPVYRVYSTGNLCTLNISAQLCDEVDVIAVVEVEGECYGISGKELAGVARKLVLQHKQQTGGQSHVRAASSH